MGVDQSREINCDIEEITNNRTKEFWKDNGYEKDSRRTQDINTGTLDEFTIIKASQVINAYVKTIENPKILEIGSGNGYNTRIISNELKKEISNLEFVATDLFAYDPSYFNIETGLLSHDAVKKYEGKFNILLLISPLPHNYMDYYAIKEFENIQIDEPKYIIFIGELGASDGGEGMYQYLLNESCWKLKYRKMLLCSRDILGGTIEKELFIFMNE